jgi:glucosamine-6-phosphate deaminase
MFQYTGTMDKLVRQGHNLHVAYQTSGNIAVFDHDAQKFVDFVREFAYTYLAADEEKK